MPGTPTQQTSAASFVIAQAGNRKLLVVALVGWFILGGIDLLTGFVDPSLWRVMVLVLLAVLLFPWHIPALDSLAQRLVPRRRTTQILSLLGLALLGFALFASRQLRGANMGDDAVFIRVIENIAQRCFFCYPDLGQSYFRFHNNLFLAFFAPLTVLPAWWWVAHFIQSVVIVAWCRVGGWAIDHEGAMGWGVTIALFLATYTQHAVFYDTRFAALALALFAVGYYSKRYWLLWGAALVALLTRETTALALSLFGWVGVWRFSNKRVMFALALVGMLWYAGSYALMRWNGGPESAVRFNTCLQGARTIPSPDCVVTSLTTDWQYKLGYTLRLLRFAPVPGALPSIIAALPDFALTWLSQDNVLYSLSWHYYMQTLGILIVGAALTVSSHKNLLARWMIASALWQFVTVFRFNLF